MPRFRSVIRIYGRMADSLPPTIQRSKRLRPAIRIGPASTTAPGSRGTRRFYGLARGPSPLVELPVLDVEGPWCLGRGIVLYPDEGAGIRNRAAEKKHRDEG